MSQTTKALLEGLSELMLKNRGSLTVKEVELLSEVIDRLKYLDELKGDERKQNGAVIAEMLFRFLTNPVILNKVTETASDLIDKLL